MAVATVELRHLLQSDFKLFDFDYEFDDTNFKTELEKAITDHYFFSEIGQETPDRFKQRFKARWQRIMPYYNKLYNTTLLSYNPLINYTITEGLKQLSSITNNQDVTGKNTTSQDGKTITNSSGTTGTKTDTTNSSDSEGSTLTTNNTQTTTNGSTTSQTNDKDSNYPQQAIAGGDYRSGEKTGTGTSSNESLSKNTGTVNNENISHSDGVTSSVGTSTSNDEGTTTNNTTGTTLSENEIVSRGTNQTDYEKTIEGLTGTSYQQLISQERANLLRIIDSVIQEMKPSFFLIY